MDPGHLGAQLVSGRLELETSRILPRWQVSSPRGEVCCILIGADGPPRSTGASDGSSPGSLIMTQATHGLTIYETVWKINFKSGKMSFKQIPVIIRLFSNVAHVTKPTNPSTLLLPCRVPLTVSNSVS